MSFLLHPAACEGVGLTGTPCMGDMATCTCPGWALGLHLQLQSKQCLVTVEKASVRHSGILIREKSLAAIGSREHRLSVLLNAPSGAWSCPDAPRRLCGTLQPLGTTASLSLCCPTWYRSQQRLLDNVAADDHPMQTSRRVGRSRKGLFLVFFFLVSLLFQNGNEQQHPQRSL